MSKQHTPALWHVEPSPDRVHFDIRVDGVHLPLTEANGRLIAAAPDLLAALRSIISWDHFEHTPDAYVEAMVAGREAIAKAEDNA